MRVALNHLGYNVERHDGPLGWQAITDPFATESEARDHMRGMSLTPGAEYRIYEALAAKGAKS